MRTPSSFPARRRAATAVVALVVASSFAACARTGGDAAPAGSPPTSAAPASTVSTPALATTTAPLATGSTAPAAPAAANAASAAYPSAIIHEEVDNPAFDTFETTMTNRMQRAGLPGVSLLVMQDGELVEQEAWMGYDLDTVVPIASASKWLTAATIMTLVDAGQIDLDAPISTYLDYAKGGFGTITMRQLLSLSSGIRADENFPCVRDMTVTLEECNREIAQVPLSSAPGEMFRYGGQHMHVAAGVAEAVTGKRWADIFQEQIAQPLGMTQTRFRGGIIFGPNASDDHPSPAGSAESTLGDYGRFLEMISHDGVAPDGTRILDSASITEMQTSQISDVSDYNGPHHRTQDRTPYGLGQWLDWADKDNNPIVLSSDGAFGFRPWIDKQNDIVGVYMIQDTGVGIVEGDPRTQEEPTSIPTSGPWVFEDVAKALGGSLPKDMTPGT